MSKTNEPLDLDTIEAEWAALPPGPRVPNLARELVPVLVAEVRRLLQVCAAREQLDEDAYHAERLRCSARISMLANMSYFRMSEQLDPKVDTIPYALEKVRAKAFDQAAAALRGPLPFTTRSEAQRIEQAMDRAGLDVGIYRKFVVERTDGSSAPGGKHELCDYFVLDWRHDRFAPAAARAYADACEAKFPALAKDLRDRADTEEKRALAQDLRDRADAAEKQRCP